MRAVLLGRRLVVLLALFGGLLLWALSSANRALRYTEVPATVDKVEEVCRPVGEPVETATAARCPAAQAAPSGKWWREHAVSVRYLSPVDDQEHTGTVIPNGGQSEVDALKLQPGDRWTVLARKTQPEDIRAK